MQQAEHQRDVIPIQAEGDILVARRRGRDIGAALGFGSVDQTRIATAISELTRNALRYAGGGWCLLARRIEGRLARIEVEVVDHGPGIPDITAAMQDGWTNSGSMGVGLPATRRLVGHLSVRSRPGLTRVRFRVVRSRWTTQAPTAEPSLDDGPFTLPVTNDAQVEVVRHATGRLCSAAGLDPQRRCEVVTAAVELATNLLRHATNGGRIALRMVLDPLVRETVGARSGIEVTSHDTGPGIDDLALALTDGFSTAAGLGSGLPSVRRLMDELEIRSGATGTAVIARKWAPSPG